MIENLALFEAEYPIVLLAICFIFGSVIGSFLNVVIHRLPIMLEREWDSQAREILGNTDVDESSDESIDESFDESFDKRTDEVFNLVLPNSHCPHCQHAIKQSENIPIVSFLALKGKCSSCKAPISIRYPLIELFTGVLTASVIAVFGLTLVGLACCVLTWALISLALIDYDLTYLPDDITLPLLWMGLILNYFDLVTTFSNAFWGAIFGYMSLWIVYQTFKLVTGKEGMGFGDFKLLGLLGAWMGWQLIPLIIILSSFAGAIVGGTLIMLGRERSNPIPFGPFLALAGWISLLWGPQINLTYLKLVS